MKKVHTTHTRKKHSDKELIIEAKEGEEAAFDFLTEKYTNLVLNISYNIVRDYYKAQDVAQEVFIKLYVNLNNIDEPYNVKSWLCRVTKNMSLNEINKKKINEEDVDNYSHKKFCDSFEEDLIYTDRQEKIREALNNLSDKNKTALVLHLIIGHTINEVSDKLEIKESGVYARVWRAKEQLKEELIDIVKLELLPVNYENACEFLLSKNKNGLLKYPSFLVEMEECDSLESSAYTIEDSSNLDSLLFIQRFPQGLPYITIFTDEPDIFRLYLNSIPSHLLSKTVSVRCYKKWMIDILEDYIDSTIRTRKYRTYMLNEDLYSAPDFIKEEEEVKLLGMEDIKYAEKFEEQYRKPRALTEDHPGRVDNLIKRSKKNNKDKIFGIIKKNNLINYIHIKYDKLPGLEEGLWGIWHIWTIKKYRRQGLAQQTLTTAINWIFNKRKKIYTFILKKEKPIKEYQKYENYEAGINLLEKVDFRKVNEQYFQKLNSIINY